MDIEQIIKSLSLEEKAALLQGAGQWVSMGIPEKQIPALFLADGKAFEGADFIYAKNWSAYTGDNYGKVLCTDRDWTVDAEKMALTDNAYFMHCLPVRRNMIVTDDVIESPQSIVIPEAANRVVSAQTVLKEILLGL